MYKLSRYFIIAGVVGMLLSTAFLGYQHQQNVLDNLIQQKINESTILSKMLANDIWEEFSPYIEELSRLPSEELVLHFAVREFDSSVRGRAAGLDILQVNIYSLSGTRVFSTEPQLLGKKYTNSAGFTSATEGKSVTELEYKELANALHRTRLNRQLIVSFIPLHNTDTLKVNAVLEIHVDITKSLAKLDNGKSDAIIVIVATLSLLLCALFIVVRRADNQLKRHELHIEAQQQQIEHQHYHDILTGLPNRNLFRERLQHAIDMAAQRELLVAVMVVNLDRFKHVNDTFGHSVGDGLLLRVVSRLKECVRSVDTLARSSGDEFYIILESISVLHEAEEIAALILREFSTALNIDGHELFVTPSIGFVMHPFANDDVDTLIKKASTAMYQAKLAGRNTYKLYDTGMVHRTATRFSMENALRSALERDEFKLHYQPLIHLKTGNVIAVEALLRWQSPKLGLISPLEFVPLLEDTGLIMPVGEWVLQTACAQTVAWQQQGILDLKVNVNLSAVQFLQNGITRQVRNALDHSGLQPHLLDLEITESLLIDDISNAMPLLDKLNDMGVSLSIDDFGTGYSSLAYLKRMPIETLKIDRSFVRDITSDVNDAAIVDAICAMANSLRFKVTAEGVETVEQLRFLRGIRVDTVQGFLFSRPLPASDLDPVLRRKNLLNLEGKIA